MLQCYHVEVNVVARTRSVRSPYLVVANPVFTVTGLRNFLDVLAIFWQNNSRLFAAAIAHPRTRKDLESHLLKFVWADSIIVWFYAVYVVRIATNSLSVVILILTKYIILQKALRRANCWVCDYGGNAWEWLGGRAAHQQNLPFHCFIYILDQAFIIEKFFISAQLEPDCVRLINLVRDWIFKCSEQLFLRLLAYWLSSNLSKDWKLWKIKSLILGRRLRTFDFFSLIILSTP